MASTTRAATITPVPKPAGGSLLQRACACGNHTHGGGECESCKKKREQMQAANGDTLQRSAVDASAQDDVPDSVYNTLRTPGQPLDTETRAFMEQRFDHDFSGVRVHTDTQAAQSARAVNAHAYTVGRDVVFGAGQYAPGTTGGQKLLAHELTHVVQQGSASRIGNLIIAPSNDRFEREAVALSQSPSQIHQIALQRNTDPAVFAQFNSAMIARNYLEAVRFLSQMTNQEISAGLEALSPENRMQLRNAAVDASPANNRVAQIIEQVERSSSPTPRSTPAVAPAQNAREQRIPVQLIYEVIQGPSGDVPLPIMSAVEGVMTGTGTQRIQPTTAQSEVDSLLNMLGGGLGAAGQSTLRFLDPIPGNQSLASPDVYTRFAGPETRGGFFERGRLTMSGDLKPRLWSGSGAQRLAAFEVFEQNGLRFPQLSELSRRLRMVGQAGLTAEELALLRRVTQVHAELAGATPASPLISLTELAPGQALNRLPPTATQRAYIVRVRIAPQDVVRVNEILQRTGASNLASEMEVVVAQDLAGAGRNAPRILSVRANPSPTAPLGGGVGTALTWIGRGLMVLGAAITIGQIVTAQGPNRREQQGQAFGSFAGGVALGAFGAGLCVGLGIATGGVVLALCGIGFGLAGMLGGGALGRTVGRQFD